MSLARKVAYNTSALTAGRIAFAVSGAIGTAVATRYLGPGPFAQLTLALVLVSVLGTLGDAGVFAVVSREIARRPEDEGRLLANTLGLAFVGTLVAAAATVGAAYLIYSGEDRALVRTGTAILSVQLLFGALAGTSVAYLTAHQRMGPAAVAAFVGSAAFLLVTGAAVTLDWGFEGIAAAYTVSGALTALPAIVLARRGLLRIAYERAVWRDLVRWAAPQGAIIVVGMLYFRIDTFLLSFLSTDQSVADYGVAYKVVEFLMFVPSYFVATLFPEFARAARRSEKLAGMTQAGFTMLQLAVVPMLLVFAGFAPQIVRIIAGPGFEGAGPVLAILTFALAFQYLNALFTSALVAFGEQKRLLIALLWVLAGNIAANAVLIPLFDARGAAVAVVLAEVAAIVLTVRIFRSTADVPRLFRPGQVVAAAAAGAAVVAAVRLGAADLPAIAVLALGVPLSLAAYAAVLWALRSVPGEIEDLLRGLRTRAAR